MPGGHPAGQFLPFGVGGEILGLVPVNNWGVEALFSLLTQNLPLRYGYIYFYEKTVNNWHDPRRGATGSV